ncbi:Cysteine protease atg4 [Dissophora globulifera]|uniref:Cysteine protease n=1 Tax=Dissophora globulifera TaxID=979702 RepID=A0A9P6R9F6_9FUNG|nr:Cysteine protease atg4 [Dissophora globulifera]
MDQPVLDPNDKDTVQAYRDTDPGTTAHALAAQGILPEVAATLTEQDHTAAAAGSTLPPEAPAKDQDQAPAPIINSNVVEQSKVDSFKEVVPDKLPNSEDNQAFKERSLIDSEPTADVVQEQPSQPLPATSQTESTETAASRLASRFSVNLSGVGLPTMASNLGLTQANSERAADMAQDLKKNVVNMWNAWFPTPTASSSSSSAQDPPRSPSGTQSLSHHPNQAQRPVKAQRTNSYTVGASAGNESKKLLGRLSLSSESSTRTGAPPEFPTAGLTDASRSTANAANSTNLTGRDTSIRVVHIANDPIAARSSTCAAPPLNASSVPIYLMGKQYPPSPTQWADFQRDFTEGLIWCTYRHSYPPIRPSNFTSDVGWGCMLRSGQGLLANALAVQFMGRDWNRPARGDPAWDIYVQMLTWFLDDMNAKSPFSVHRIALLGKQLGKNIGEWFGPSTTSQVTKALVHNFPQSGLSVYVTTDGVIYKDQVEEAATQKNSGGFGHLLILVTIRLGIDKLNPIYNDAIKATFEFPQSLGIAGGRPSSSYYFVGYQGDDLFYLDPHHSRCVVETKDLDLYTPEDFATYHCETIRKIDINSIDPSMLLAFYCRDRSEFEAFCERVQALNARPGMGSSIFTIGEKAPDYEDDNGERLLSVADEEDDDLELIL